MAKWSYDDVYDFDTWTVLYDDAQAYPERFLEFCRKGAEEADFPNLEIETIELRSGKVFHREKTDVLSISFRDSSFSNLAVMFRAQQFGNTLCYSVIKLLERGMWGKITGKGGEERFAKIIEKCKNFMQLEELLCLNGLGDLLFVNAMRELDPEFAENQQLVAALNRAGGRVKGAKA